MTTDGSYPHARVRPLAYRSARITGGLWGRTIATSRTVGVPACYDRFEEAGSIDNFRVLSEGLRTPHSGGPNNNEFVYKWLEACGHYAGTEGAGRAEELLAEVSGLVLRAQEPDGYLNTYYQHPEHRSSGARRFDPENRFEFYDFGHLAQAGIAWYRSRGERRLLDAAVRFADLIVASFSRLRRFPYRMNRGPLHLKREHPNHEMAMVELYRVTGRRAYLEFARQTLEEYGFWEQSENEGHAVQETLLACAAADLYLELGEPEMLEASRRLWDDMYLRKMYVTGGIGSRYVSESYGDAYELPNDRAYAETCAAVSSVLWCHRMLLATGESRYADTLERVLYNAFLAGVSLSGDRYLYQNPLVFRPGSRHLSPDADGELQAADGRRWEWHRCPCCPPNMHRLLASLAEYCYTADETGVQVHLYGDSTVEASLPGGGSVRLAQRTDYPWDGHVVIHVGVDGRRDFVLSLRIPDWCAGARIRVNGQDQGAAEGGGYAAVDRTWSDGDEVELSLPLEVRLEEGHPYTANTGRVAVCRGPLVYCIEQADNPGLDVLDVHLSKHASLSSRFEPALLDGVVSLTGQAVVRPPERWREKPYVLYRTPRPGEPRDVKLIPFYAWANREPGAMQVWLPLA